MLAQNFKTAKELGLGEAELAAHITVLGMLERGELRHEPCPTRHLVGNAFNMNYDGYSATDGCGTAACIGGWVAAVLKFDREEYVFDAHASLTARRDLYFPEGYIEDWEDITPAQAATALRNYLTHGEPRWGEALS